MNNRLNSQFIYNSRHYISMFIGQYVTKCILKIFIICILNIDLNYMYIFRNIFRRFSFLLFFHVQVCNKLLICWCVSHSDGANIMFPSSSVSLLICLETEYELVFFPDSSPTLNKEVKYCFTFKEKRAAFLLFLKAYPCLSQKFEDSSKSLSVTGG